jgi:hypothetical protein
MFSVETCYFAPSALTGSSCPYPGRLPWAITFRAFGAENQEFSHTLGSDRVGDGMLTSQVKVTATVRTSCSRERQPTRYPRGGTDLTFHGKLSSRLLIRSQQEGK